MIHPHNDIKGIFGEMNYWESAFFCSGFLLILLIETVAGKCLGGRRRRSKKIKKKIGDDEKEEKRMPETPETVQMVERWVEVES